jgi:5-methylcytosine-specific restriction endonuclease McrA
MVDHIVELKDGGDRLVEGNAMSLCWKCHGVKTVLMKNHRRSSKDNRLVSATDTYYR